MAEALNADRFVERMTALVPEADRGEFLRSSRGARRRNPVREGLSFDMRMRDIFDLAKEFIDLLLEEIEKLLDNPVTEVRRWRAERDGQAGSKEQDAGRTQEGTVRPVPAPPRPDRLLELVDLGAPHVVGRYLWDKPREVLYELARSRARGSAAPRS